MNIAILGSGRVGAALASGLSRAGHSLILGVRDLERARSQWRGPELRFAALTEATRGASVIINATPGDSSVATLRGLRSELQGKVLIDVANATKRGPNGLPAGLLYPDSSLGQELQAALPETKVVKALNTVLFPVMANPGLLSSPATVFLCGDHDDAKTTARQLLRDLGWEDKSIEDFGGIDAAQGTEALILLATYIIRSRGFIPFALTVAY
jgi:8-hydroxy-5-deazaflavin:NADPH oxidoreductase